MLTIRPSVEAKVPFKMAKFKDVKAKLATQPKTTAADQRPQTATQASPSKNETEDKRFIRENIRGVYAIDKSLKQDKQSKQNASTKQLQ
jgi:phage regulator Rha-like protein